MNLSNVRKDDIDAIANLDAGGFLLAPDEPLDEYKKRISAIAENLEKINGTLRNSQNFDLDGVCVLKEADRIPAEIMAEASQTTRDAYGFQVDWAPGFFMSKSLGLLWGGCAILIPESYTAVFLIRSSFRKKKKWLFYRRDELLSHELCHAARMPIGDRRFDENFAYRLSPSRLRKNFGSCFRREADAVLFIAPIFLLLAVHTLGALFATRIPITPFWLLALAYPLFLLIRNHLTSSTLKKAARTLSETGFENPYAILFRCNQNEIVEIADFANSPECLEEENSPQRSFAAWLDKKKESELRWKIILHRFGTKKRQPDPQTN